MYLQLVRAYDTTLSEGLFRRVITLRELARQHDLPTLTWQVASTYVDGRPRPRAESPALQRVIAPDGSILIETKRMSEQLPAQLFPQVEGFTDLVYQGRTFKLISMSTSEGYRIQVARDITPEGELIASYRRRLWLVLGAGLILSALAGLLIARRGLRPVEEIAAAVGNISSSTLSGRVKLTGLPSELCSLATTFNKTLDRLEDAFARMGRFSSDIAHELRTPIANLRGESEVALSRARSVAEYREVLESSLEEYVRLSTMIDRLYFSLGPKILRHKSNASCWM